MRRAFITGGLLLLCGAIAARSKTESLLFVFLRVDHEHAIAILRPMIAREHDAIVEGQFGKVGELVLDCGEHKFVVKTLDFRPQRR
jgi:hypothetical protein